MQNSSSDSLSLVISVTLIAASVSLPVFLWNRIQKQLHNQQHGGSERPVLQGAQVRTIASSGFKGFELPSEMGSHGKLQIMFQATEVTEVKTHRAEDMM